MARIFLALSLFAVALLVVNLILGFTIGDLQQAARELVAAQQKADRLQQQLGSDTESLEQAQKELRAAMRQYAPYRSRVGTHVLVGVAAALVSILVNSITITYFIGTTRWCREVVETYNLDPELAERSRRLKRGSFPWSLIGILTILAIVTLGAVSDPGANFETSQRWVLPHQLAALSGIVIIGLSLLMQVGKIGANYEVIEQILDEVRRVRKQRGLPELTEHDLAKTRLS